MLELHFGHLAEDVIVVKSTTRFLAGVRPNPKPHSKKAEREAKVKKRGKEEAVNYRTR